MYLCVLCGSQNKQPLFPYTTLTDWFYNRYAMCLLRVTDWIYVLAILLNFFPHSLEGAVRNERRRDARCCSSDVRLQTDKIAKEPFIGGICCYRMYSHGFVCLTVSFLFTGSSWQVRKEVHLTLTVWKWAGGLRLGECGLALWPVWRPNTSDFNCI